MTTEREGDGLHPDSTRASWKRRGPRLSDVAEREIEESFNNRVEAFALLDLINTEFQSDPMSVQCFDLRIVERVKACVAKQKRFEERYPWLKG